MKPELQNELFLKYPRIFKEDRLVWGFECKDGWYKLIDRLAAYLQFQIDHNNHYQIVATQVKEKFGSMRFYYEGADNRLDKVISFVEYLSGSICETCGKFDAKTYDINGWLITLCPECLNIRKQSQNIKINFTS